MKFETGSSKDGPYEFGYEQGWHWSKNGGNHAKGRDFFSIHWEINDRNPESVKLHVESPAATIEPQLNSIKQQIVEALLSIQFKNLIEKNGYTYIVGRNVSPERIKENKSTQAFRVLLTEDQHQTTHQANIEKINTITSQAISAVIEPFTTQLNRHFSP